MAIFSEVEIQAALVQGLVAGIVVIVGVYLAELVRRSGERWRDIRVCVREAQKQLRIIAGILATTTPEPRHGFVRWSIIYDGLSDAFSSACEELIDISTKFRYPLGRARRAEFAAERLVVDLYEWVDSHRTGAPDRAAADRAFLGRALEDAVFGIASLRRRSRYLERTTGRLPEEQRLLELRWWEWRVRRRRRAQVVLPEDSPS